MFGPTALGSSDRSCSLQAQTQQKTEFKHQVVVYIQIIKAAKTSIPAENKSIKKRIPANKRDIFGVFTETQLYKTENRLLNTQSSHSCTQYRQTSPKSHQYDVKKYKKRHLVNKKLVFFRAELFTYYL